MTRYLSLTRTGLTVLLLVGIASALHAQTSTNSAATNSTYSPDAPKANRVLLQNSGGSPIIFPDPETILGHRLLLEMGTRNATTQRANEDYFITTGKARSLAHQRPAITHRYFVTDIGTLGGTESFAFAINDSGRVVGLSRIAGDATTHSFLYSNGRITDLYPLNSQDIQTVGPTGINNSGQIASGLVIGGVYSPAIFDSRTGITLLGSLGGVTSYGFNGVATSINNRGDAVGYSYIDSINRHAFLYSNGVMTDIDSFGGYSVAFAINNKGVIVGFASYQYNGTGTAFVYSHGVMTDIFPVGTESYARGVNNRGEVVGEFLTADQSAFHAFLYSKGVITDISSPARSSFAFAINDQEQVVGTDGAHAFVYESGNMADLNTLIPSDSGWVLSWAFDINNYGQIVGYGLVNDKFLAFLLTPATSDDQCKNGGWQTFGFKNQGQCIQFVNTGK